MTRNLSSSNIANYLSLTRIGLAIVLSLMIIFLPKSLLSTFLIVVVCTIACLSDFFDGYLARKFKICSSLGAELDPAADKILVILVLVALAYKQRIVPINLIAVFLIIIREVIVSTLRATALILTKENNSSNDSGIKTKYMAKIKTTMQFVAMFAFILMDAQILSYYIHIIATIALWASAYTAIITAVSYSKEITISLN